MRQGSRQIVEQFLSLAAKGAVSRLLSAVESHPVPVHSARDRRKGGQFGSLLKRMQPYGHKLDCTWVYKGAFLWGVANYLRDLPHEELILGFGAARSTRICIQSVMKIRGEAERVRMSPDAEALIHQHLDENESHSVMLVHNHPANNQIAWLMGLFFGDDPLPSLIDRDAALEIFRKRLESKLRGFALGKVRLYVVQNDHILEFSGFTPALLLDWLRAAWMMNAATNVGRAS